MIDLIIMVAFAAIILPIQIFVVAYEVIHGHR